MRNKHLSAPIYIIAVIIYFFVPLTNYGPELSVYFFNVGQGDSTYIKTPQGTTILIDGGPNGKVIDELDKIRFFWDKNIDVIMLTHPDLDHISGLVDVLQRYNIKQVLSTPSKSTEPAYTAFIEELNKQGINQTNFLQGSALKTPDGVSMKGLWPPTNSDWQKLNKLNDGSQVVRLDYGEFTILLTGDIDTQIANSLKVEDLGGIEIIKVPHHGSRFGFKTSHISEINPLIGIISVGSDNRYGHPAPKVIEDLSAHDVAIFRTDKDGSINITVNGSGISVNTE